MAGIKYSSLVTEIKGKLGNTVFQRMGKSFGVRSQSSSNYTNSIWAQQWRNSFNLCVNQWNILSSADKQLWVNMAPSWPATNRFGVSITLSGFQLFMQINTLLLYTEYDLILIPSSFITLPQPTCLVSPYMISAQHFVWNISAPADNDIQFFLYVSLQYPSYSSNKNPKTMFFAISFGSNVGGQETFTVFNNRFKSAMIPGLSLFCEVWAIHTTNGSYRKVHEQQVQVVA